MKTTAQFYTAPFSDAVSKAAKVAPTKGSAFDKAAGIVVVVNPANPFAIIKSTDIECSYVQKIPVVAVTGERKEWRLSSRMLDNLLKQLPMGAGASVKILDQEDSFLRVKSNRFTGKLRSMDATTFPSSVKWKDFDLSTFGEANEFASMAEQVAWATKSTDPSSPLYGVHIDGTRLIACDAYCMALRPCVVPVDSPITVSLDRVAGLLKSATDVRLRADETRLWLHLDAETQASSTLITLPYPNVLGIMRDTFTGSATFSKTEFIETLQRLLVLIQSDKSPTLTVTMNGPLSRMVLDVALDAERMQDVIDIKTDFAGEWTFKLTPTYIANAVGGCRADQVTMFFGDPTNDPKKTIAVEDGAGYHCTIMPKIVD